MVMSKWMAAVAVAALLALAGGGQAASILLDFGSTTVLPADAAISPAHEDGGLSASEATWNHLQTADLASGVVYGDGTAMTGGTVNLGTGALASVDFNTNPASTSALGSAYNTGVYSGTSVAKDGIFNANGAIGIQITGLSAGDYDIYFTGRNTNTANDPSYVAYAAAGGAAPSFDFSSAATGTWSNSFVNNASLETGGTKSFELGDHYGTIRVSVAAGQALFLAVDPSGTRPFVNSIEIVAVPEPATMALLASGGLFLLRRRRQVG